MMVFKAIIHNPSAPDKIAEIHMVISQFRAEKTAKYLEASGISHDMVLACLQKETGDKTYGGD